MSVVQLQNFPTYIADSITRLGKSRFIKDNRDPVVIPVDFTEPQDTCNMYVGHI